MELIICTYGMKENLGEQLLVNFVLGGLTVALTSYIGTFVSPVTGALVWAYPVTIIPSIFFMREQKKSNNYIATFLVSTTFALILLMGTTYLLSHIIRHSDSKESLWTPIGKSLVGFAFGAVIYYYIIHALKLERQFEFSHVAG